MWETSVWSEVLGIQVCIAYLLCFLHEGAPKGTSLRGKGRLLKQCNNKA